jgi:hypothetical protein
MKFSLIAATLMAGSASAFAPSAFNVRSTTTLSAEASKSMPWMNRPALVRLTCRPNNISTLLVRLQEVNKQYQ